MVYSTLTTLRISQWMRELISKILWIKYEEIMANIKFCIIFFYVVRANQLKDSSAMTKKLAAPFSYIVEEQIDETDIRKIPQIVWAESGSLTVPV